MPVKIARALAELRAAAKAPREGYFSVLDELIGQMPDRPLSVEEIQQRLKPGRMLQREDMRFPLKQEEIDYALAPSLRDLSEAITPANLRERVRQMRPGFHIDDVDETGEYASYSTRGPNRLTGDMPDDHGYFASATGSSDFGQFGTHFADDTLSFSRGTRHEIEPRVSDESGNLPAQGRGTLRLIDEIQNDRANRARQKIAPNDALLENRREFARLRGHAGHEARLNDEYAALNAQVRPRGWRTPEDESLLEQARVPGHDGLVSPDDLEGYREAHNRVPDAPFKDPASYGRLEIKNQLLDALEYDDAALGITPSSGPASWFPGTGAKDATYDRIYPGELRKIAQQYGAPFSPIPLPVKSFDPMGLDTLQGTDIFDFVRTADWDRGEPLLAYEDLLNELGPRQRLPRGYDERGSSDQNAYDRAVDQLDYVRELENNLHPNNRGVRIPDDDLTNARSVLDDLIVEAYEEVAEQQRGLGKNTMTRDIPSMHLTPEVKERIARIGLPLFTAAGAAIMSPENLQNIGAGESSIPEGFKFGGLIRRGAGTLKRIKEHPRNPRGDEQAWQMDMEARKAAREAARARMSGQSTEGGDDYGAYMERRAEASVEPTRGRRRAAPELPPDVGTLEGFRRILGLYRGGSVEGYANGGPVGMTPPNQPMMPQAPSQGLINLNQYPAMPGGIPVPPYGTPPYAPPGMGGNPEPQPQQQHGGMLNSILSNPDLLRSGWSGLTGMFGGAGPQSAASYASTFFPGAAPAAGGTGILGTIGTGLGKIGTTIGSGLSSAGSALAGMGPVGWAGAAALAAGAVAAKNAPSSSPLNKFDLNSGGWSKPENFAGQKYAPEVLNAYYGPAIEAFKQTGNVKAALAALPPPSTPEEQKLYAGRQHLFGGTGNPFRQIAKQMGLKDGAWKAGSKEKKALMKEIEAAEKAAKTAAKSGMPQAPQRVATAPNILDLQNQAIATNAAAPKELDRVQPQGARVQPGANEKGLLSRIQQQQASR